MASTNLTPVRPDSDGGSAFADGETASPLIRRPAELVELAELVYRGVFEAGLVVAAIASVYAAVLSALQPPGQRAVAGAVCSLLLLGQLAALRWRSRLYPLLRRWPWWALLPALALGAGAWAAGPRNQQLFYVLTILLGALGAALPFRVISVASLVAAVGLALPHITDGSWAIGEAVAAGLLPPLLWLILEHLARFMLRLHQALDQPATGPPRRVRVRVDRTPSRRAPPEAFLDSGQHESVRSADRSARSDQPGGELTARQLQVLLLCAEGLQNHEISDCLGITAVQVGRHLRRAKDRVGVASTPELVAWGICSGLIPSHEAEAGVQRLEASQRRSLGDDSAVSP